MLSALKRMAADDLARRRAVRRLRRQWERSAGAGSGVDRESLAATLRLARQQIALQQQVKMLEATRRVFRYWHAAHLPVGITALAAVLVHVVVVIVLGATWFR